MLSRPRRGERCVSLPTLLIRRPWLALLSLGLLLGLAFQGTRGLWEPDEGRYTNVALQMIHSGDYVSLRRNEEALHFTKPPVTYWAIAGSVNAFGRTEWAVRLPMALAFALTVLLVYDMGRRLVPAKPWLPALVYATCPLVVGAASVVTTDTVLAFTEALAVACYVRARFGVDGGTPGSRWWLDAMWTAFGLAFLTKGPPALLPLLAIIAFEVSQRRGLRLLRPLGLLGFAVVGFTWFWVVIRRHPGLLDYFLGHEVYARIATDKLRRFPQWYGPFLVYIPTLLFGSLPWLLVAWRARRTDAPAPLSPRADDALRFLWLWLALPLLVFSLARSRLPLYLLPLFAPLALLLARAIAPMRWTALGWKLLGGWVLVLLALKLAAAHYPSDKDGRIFASKLTPMLPGHPDELLFIEDTTRNGLNLYLDTNIERLSFKPQPKMMSDSSYDQTVAEELDEDEQGRVFIMKRSVEQYFLDAVKEDGESAVLLGVIDDRQGRRERERVVYTLSTDFAHLAGRKPVEESALP
jgi:4-amino-4-deoxy-L-arabinose transferase-like glycosyltransferase